MGRQYFTACASEDPLGFLWADGTLATAPRTIDYSQQRVRNHEILELLGAVDVSDPCAMYQEGSDECEAWGCEMDNDDIVEKRQRVEIHGYPIFI